MNARRTLAAALAAVCLLFPGCTGESRSLLWYQDRLASVSLSEGERAWEIVPDGGGWTVTLTAPPSAAGVTYRITDTAAEIRSGSVTIPAGEAMTAVPRQLIALFSLAEESLISVEAERDGAAVTASYRTEAGKITVRIGEGGLPLSFGTEAGEWTVTDCRLTEAGGNE